MQIHLAVHEAIIGARWLICIQHLSDYWCFLLSCSKLQRPVHVPTQSNEWEINNCNIASRCVSIPVVSIWGLRQVSFFFDVSFLFESAPSTFSSSASISTLKEKEARHLMILLKSQNKKNTRRSTSIYITEYDITSRKYMKQSHLKSK